MTPVQNTRYAPHTVAVASLGQVGLVASARPDTFPGLVALAEHRPMSVVAAVVAVAGLAFLVSRLSARPALLIRQGVLGLIAASLVVIAFDFLNFVNADQPPWSVVLYGVTGLVLIGGLASLIVKLRNRIN